ncbi:MAG: dienelactone hydrolase family protein [Pseudorhodoplanes sp.]
MGTASTLTASDHHQFATYRADPKGKPKGGLVVVQEIFGVNHHIRNVCDRVAAEGYVAIAPALFDRLTRNFETGYSADELTKAIDVAQKIDRDAMLRDVAATVAELKPAGRIGVIGFCMGGSIAFLSAARLDGVAAAVGFYGGQIAAYADEKPKCPVQLHFGEKDDHIPMSDVEKIKAKRPEIEVYTYPARHGFCCDERSDFDAPSAKLAWERSYAFLDRHLAGRT